MKHLLLLLFFLTSPAFASQNCNEALFLFKANDLILNKNFTYQPDSLSCPDRFINPLNDRLSAGNVFLDFEYTTETVKVPFRFEELIPSCAIDSKGIFTLCVRVSSDGESWSQWFQIGSWGGGIENYVSEDYLAKVKTDYISAKDELSYFQLRILSSSNSDKIRSLSAAISSEKTDANLKLSRESVFMNRYCGVDLDVPFKSQTWEDKDIAGHICSPISIAMIMAYYSVNVTSKALSAKVYDARNDMYGIWWRAIQVASVYGFDGYVRYFRSYDDVGEYLLRGIPVAACVCFEENELTGAATQASEGHVVVLSGFDPNGNPICRDGAWSNANEGIVVYGREEFGKSWFDRGGGVGYIILPN